MRVVALSLIGLLSIAACAQVGSDLGIGLPALVKPYSSEFQTRAADELQALPEGSALAVMIADYAVLREQLRAAR